jgi:predicted lipid carrier protein YhbT
VALPSIPAPLSGLLARLPQYPPSAVCAAAMTLVLGERMGSDAQPEFDGKVIRIVVTDAGLTFTLRVRARNFVAVGNIEPDVTMSARAADFMDLILQREDPDTLFFSRRLLLEGDTDLGLCLKNALDALDYKPSLPMPKDVLRLLRSYFE